MTFNVSIMSAIACSLTCKVYNKRTNAAECQNPIEKRTTTKTIIDTHKSFQFPKFLVIGLRGIYEQNRF